MKRIHIVSASPRTGTTLLAECMRHCFEIDAYEEHEAPITHLRWSAKVYLTKRASSVLYSIARLRLDPRVTLICMIRDPRDVIVSKHAYDPGRYWTSLHLWESQAPLIRTLRNHPRFLLVRYEDLAADPDGVQRFIAERIPYLRERSRFSEFGEGTFVSAGASLAMNGARKITPSSIGAWRQHLPRVAGQLKRYGSLPKQLIEFGYEKDDAWLSELENVTPDLAPSHWDKAKPISVTRLLQANLNAAWCGLCGRLGVPLASLFMALNCNSVIGSLAAALA